MQKRRNYFIKKGFQINFGLRFIILLLLESVFIISLFMHISTDTITAGYQNSILTIERTPNFFLISFFLIMLIVVTSIAMIGLVAFILLSHRIAGPLYRFEQVLKQITDGDLTAKVEIRKTDELLELKALLNSMQESLGGHILTLKNDVIEIEKLLLKKDDPDFLPSLNRVINSLKDKIGYFKLNSSPTKE